MSLLDTLLQWVERKPLVLLRLEDDSAQALRESRRGIDCFTVAKPHSVFHELKLPTLCLAEVPEGATRECYVGVVTSKVPVTTFDSRLTVIKLQALNLSSLDSLGAKLAEPKFRTALRYRSEVHNYALSLSPKLSVAIINTLATDPEDRKPIELVAWHVPGLRHLSTPEWEQLDAIRTAMAVFGLSKSALPELVDVPDGSDSTLNHLGTHALEDNVIARDASIIPGFKLIEKHVTGRAVFQKGLATLQFRSRVLDGR